jgi:putative peptidoglycan lipid II flippase
VSALLKSVVSISAATALSRITGFLRTMTQAATLGTGVVANAYTFSNTLPNQVYELFMGGLLSSIFIPILVERLTNKGPEDARELVGALLTLILPVLLAVVAIGVVFANPIVAFTTGWGGDTGGDTTELAVLLFRIFAVQILFYGLGALGIGILNSHRRFFLAAFAPVLNNLIVIAAFGGYALLAPARLEAAILLLAWGTTLGVAAMGAVLLPTAYRLGYRPRPRLGHPALGTAARLAGPMFVFVAASVGVQLFAYYLATRFDAAPDLQYAFVVFQLPYGVFIVSITMALMPDLSERSARNDTDGYREMLSFGLRTASFISVPAAVGMATLSVPTIGLLYQRGGFEAGDTRVVAAILASYAFGLVGYSAYFVLARSFYARQNTRIPAAINVGLLAVYVAAAVPLSAIFGIRGVALALTVSYGAAALALLAAMRREIGGVDGRRLASSLLKIGLAGAAMYTVATAGVALLGEGDGTLQYALTLALVGAASLGAYLLAALLLRVEELRSALAMLRRRTPSEDRAS